MRDRCPGITVHMARDQGYSLLRPIREGPAAGAARQRVAHLPVRQGVATGRPLEAAAPSLPPHPMPADAPVDPLADRAAR